ncbi:hypothetical protein AB5N19_13991 [Seiridium cardinale]
MSDKSPPELYDGDLIDSVHFLLVEPGRLTPFQAWAAAKKMCNSGRLSKHLLQQGLEDFASLSVQDFRHLLENQPGGQQAAFDKADNDHDTITKLARMDSFDVFKTLLGTKPFSLFAEHKSGLFAFISGIGLPKTILSIKAGQYLSEHLPHQGIRVAVILQCRGEPLSDPLQTVLSIVWSMLKTYDVVVKVKQRPAIILNILAAATLQQVWPHFVELVDLVDTFVLILDSLQSCNDNNAVWLIRNIDVLAHRQRSPTSLRKSHAVVKVIITSLTHDCLKIIPKYPPSLLEYKMIDLQEALEEYFKSKDIYLGCEGWQITAPALEAASNLGGGLLVLRALMGPAHIKRSPEEVEKFLRAVLSRQKLKSLRLQSVTFKDISEHSIVAAILLVLVENTEPLTAAQIQEQICQHFPLIPAACLWGSYQVTATITWWLEGLYLCDGGQYSLDLRSIKED